MVRVCHIVERFPVPQHAFIYRQVREERGDVVWTLRRCRGPSNGMPVRVEALRNAVPGAELLDRVRARVCWEGLAARTRHAVSQAAERHRCEILHAHFGMAGALAAGRRPDLPLVTSFYGVDASACLADPRWRTPLAPLFRSGTRFVVLSDAVAERLARAGCRADRIDVWDIPIDLSRFTPGPRPSAEGAFRVLCAARFVEKKGHPTLLEALSSLSGRLDARLTLVGYGSGISAVRKEVSRRALDDAVEVIDTAHLEDFEGFYLDQLRRHHAVALASTVASDGDDEAGPALTVVMAQAAGVPVVVTPFAGSERSVIDGRSGLIAADGGAIAEALFRIAREPGLAQRLGSEGSAYVSERFAASRQLARLESIYERALRCS